MLLSNYYDPFLTGQERQYYHPQPRQPVLVYSNGQYYYVDDSDDEDYDYYSSHNAETYNPWLQPSYHASSPFTSNCRRDYKYPFATVQQRQPRPMKRQQPQPQPPQQFQPSKHAYLKQQLQQQQLQQQQLQQQQLKALKQRQLQQQQQKQAHEQWVSKANKAASVIQRSFRAHLQNRQANAAIVIQHAFQRFHAKFSMAPILKSMKKLHAIKAKVQNLESTQGHVLKSHLDVSTEGTILFTEQNKPFLQFENELTRIMLEVDEVSSHGCDSVREYRRHIVMLIQSILDIADKHKIEERAAAAKTIAMSADTSDGNDVDMEANDSMESPSTFENEEEEKLEDVEDDWSDIDESKNEVVE